MRRWLFPARWREVDWGVLLTAGLLVAFGLAAMASLSINAPDHDLGTFLRQLIFFGVGLVLMASVITVDYRALRSGAWLVYGASLALLAGLFLAGTTIRGTRGWYEFFGQTFQPVEFVKVAAILILAKVLADRFDPRQPWRSLPHTAAVMVPLLALVLAQPDLGSAVVLAGVWIGMLLLARVPGRVLLAVFAIGIVVAAVAWIAILADYQHERILTFFDPGRDPLGAGYNVRQARVAVGSGQLFGRGLGLGPQSQLDFLPVQETDFIFAVIAEELGFVGSVLVLGLFGLFFSRLFRLLRAVTDDFAAFVVGGALILFFLQTSLNIGMNMGLLPIAGLPLPFLSYGGSALIAMLVLVGLLEGIAIRTRRERVGELRSRPTQG